MGWSARRRSSTDTEAEPSVALDGVDVGTAEWVVRDAARYADSDEQLQLEAGLAIVDLRRQLLGGPAVWVADVVELIVSGTPSIDRIRVPGLSCFALRRRLRSMRSDMVEAGLIAS